MPLRMQTSMRGQTGQQGSDVVTLVPTPPLLLALTTYPNQCVHTHLAGSERGGGIRAPSYRCLRFESDSARGPAIHGRALERGRRDQVVADGRHHARPLEIHAVAGAHGQRGKTFPRCRDLPGDLPRLLAGHLLRLRSCAQRHASGRQGKAHGLPDTCKLNAIACAIMQDFCTSHWDAQRCVAQQHACTGALTNITLSIHRTIHTQTLMIRGFRIVPSSLRAGASKSSAPIASASSSCNAAAVSCKPAQADKRTHISTL